MKKLIDIPILDRPREKLVKKVLQLFPVMNF